MEKIKIVKGMLDGIIATSVNKDYVGSVTIDGDLLDKAGIFPMEEVIIANLVNGKRLKTYILPAPKKSGVVCPNGGCYYMCRKGDPLLVFNYRYPSRQPTPGTYISNHITVDEHNKIVKHVTKKSEEGFGGEELRLMRSKLHQFAITDSKKEAPTCVEVDEELLRRVGILPFEEVQLVNLDNGNRVTVHAVYGKKGSRTICVNGEASFCGKKGDKILLFSFRYVKKEYLKKKIYKSQIVLSAQDNEIKEYFEQRLHLDAQGGVYFETPDLQYN